MSNVFPVNISNDSYSSSSIIPSTPRQLLCIGPHQLHLLTIHTPESTRQQIIRHLFVNTKQRENKKIVRGISSSTRCAQVNKGTYYRYFGTLFNNSILRIKASPSYDFKHRPSSFEQPYPYGKDLEIGSLTRLVIPGVLSQGSARTAARGSCAFVAWQSCWKELFGWNEERQRQNLGHSREEGKAAGFCAHEGNMELLLCFCAPQEPLNATGAFGYN